MSQALQRPNPEQLERHSSPFLMAKAQREGLLQHFGFNESPFGVTPDPDFLFWSGMHNAAFQGLISSIESNLGFSVLLGEPGTGKTTLVFQLLTLYRERARTAFVFHTQCSPHDLLRHICSELELEDAEHDEVSLHLRLKSVLVDEARRGRKVIIVIDEAQNLQPVSLEAVRLLSDFETAPSKLLHVVLAGSLALRDTLLLPELSQLAQRIPTICHLEPLDCEGVKEYVRFRLGVARARHTGELFPPESLSEVTLQSRGIPRVVNAICYRSLVLAYLRSERSVQPELVVQAARDIDFSQTGGREWMLPEKFEKAIADPLPDSSASPAASLLTSVSPGPWGTEARPKESSRTVPEATGRSHPQPVPTPYSNTGTKSSRSSSGIHSSIFYVLGFILFALCSWLAWNRIPGNSNTAAESTTGSAPSSVNASGTHSSVPATNAVADRPGQSSQNNGREQSPGTDEPLSATANTGGSEKLPQSVASRQEPAVVDLTADAQSPSRITRRPKASEEPAIPGDVERFSKNESLKNPVAGLASAPAFLREPPETVTTPKIVGSVPRAIKIVQPQYPQQARLRHVQGEVQLEVSVDSDGHVREIHPIKGHPILIDAAETAVRQWQFSPTASDEDPGPLVTRIRFNFKLSP